MIEVKCTSYCANKRDSVHLYCSDFCSIYNFDFCIVKKKSYGCNFLYGPSLKFIFWSVKYTKRVFLRIIQNSKLKSCVLYCKIVLEKKFFHCICLAINTYHLLTLYKQIFLGGFHLTVDNMYILRVISCYNFKVQSLLYEKKRLCKYKLFIHGENWAFFCNEVLSCFVFSFYIIPWRDSSVNIKRL